MTEAGCVDNAPPVLTTPTRNRYPYGKLLDSAHLTLEQDYINSKRWLLNRLVIGPGVLCGLPVAPTSNGQGVVVGQGVAIDPHGREIVVPAPSVAVDFRKLTDQCGRPTGRQAEPGSNVTLCLSYAECLADFVPGLTTDCDGMPHCEASSVQERYRLVLLGHEVVALERTCYTPGLWTWPVDLRGGEAATLRLDSEALTRRVSRACPEGPDDCVPLAIITVPAEGEALTDAAIYQSVRPVVYSNMLLAELMSCLAEQLAGGQLPDIVLPPTTPRPLTAIAEANWLSHGPTVVEVSVSDFNQGLVVDFTGPVSVPDGPGQGWFLVTFEALKATRGSADIEVVRVREQEITFPEPTRAVFVPHQGASNLIETLGLPLLCRVVVKCGVLLDGAGAAVDGDYLASMPTGDGVAGGDFESWFILT